MICGLRDVRYRTVFVPGLDKGGVPVFPCLPRQFGVRACYTDQSIVSSASIVYKRLNPEYSFYLYSICLLG